MKTTALAMLGGWTLALALTALPGAAQAACPGDKKPSLFCPGDKKPSLFCPGDKKPSLFCPGDKKPSFCPGDKKPS